MTLNPPGWQWLFLLDRPTPRTVQRFLIGILSLQPLPNGGPCELRLYLKQWDVTAADPMSWCLEWMKFSARPGTTKFSPYQGLQHVQISQKDWPTFFESWGTVGERLLQRLTEITGPIEDKGGSRGDTRSGTAG